MHLEWPDQEISYTYTVGSASQDPSNSLNPGQSVLMANNTKTYGAATISRLAEINNIKLDQVLSSCLSKKNISKVSPFTAKRSSNSVPNLKNFPLRLYTEPDFD